MSTSSVQPIGQFSQMSHFADPKNKVLNSRILTRNIFKFVDSYEANTLPSVSRIWKQLILENKKSMFFVKNQVAFLHGSLQAFPKANYYFLGERHKNKICKSILRELILGLARDNFVLVLLEGLPSLVHGIPKGNEFLIVNVKHFTGIDMLDPALDDIEFAFAGWDIIDYEKQQDEMQALKKNTDDQVSRLINDIKKLKQEETTASEERRAQIQKEKERLNLIGEIFLLQQEIGDESMIRDSFPNRTQSMTDSINLIESSYMHKQEQGKPMKVIIHCGAEHLRSVRSFVEYDICPLYHTLGKIKAVVMLPSFIR
jgi:hypothetical protein